MVEEKKETPATRMKIKTNPAFDPDTDPTEQEWAYVNPVALNNDLIVIANEMLTLAEYTVQAINENKGYRLSRRKLQREQDDFETKLLAEDPLNPAEGKNLKTTAAALERRITQGQHSKVTEDRVKRIREYEDAIERNDDIIKTAKIYWDTAERISDNIKTHLSFVKDEKRNRF